MPRCINGSWRIRERRSERSRLSDAVVAEAEPQGVIAERFREHDRACPRAARRGRYEVGVAGHEVMSTRGVGRRARRPTARAPSPATSTAYPSSRRSWARRRALRVSSSTRRISGGGSEGIVCAEVECTRRAQARSAERDSRPSSTPRAREAPVAGERILCASLPDATRARGGQDASALSTSGSLAFVTACRLRCRPCSHAKATLDPTDRTACLRAIWRPSADM